VLEIGATLIAQPVEVPLLLKSLADKLSGAPGVVIIASLKLKTYVSVPLDLAGGVDIKVATGAVRSTIIGPADKQFKSGDPQPRILPAVSVMKLFWITGTNVPSLPQLTDIEYVNPGTIVVDSNTQF
jgi:hypothetical protein